ncbi:MAG: type VI secretion system contractile sheath small subunit [Candidatus Desantisbacteria bacterium]
MAGKSFQDEIPPSRVNIKYVNATKGAKEALEIPFKLLMIGDYTLRKDETPLEERKKLNINKTTFSTVMKEQGLNLSMVVPNKLVEEEGSEMKVSLKFDDLSSFEPDAVAHQIPELNDMLKIRELLKDLKARVITNRKFREELGGILKDKDSMDAVLKQLDEIAPLQ